jgi:hypothetical protein
MSRLGLSFRRTLHCSFCARSEHAVARLIAGPKVFICDECVGLCVNILDGNGPAAPAATARPRLLGRVRAWFVARAGGGSSHPLGVLR